MTESKSLNELLAADDPPPTDKSYDEADGCKAIVAVAEDGSYIMLKKPNLWMFDAEPAPQDNGFGDSFDLAAGVYEMTFAYKSWTDQESGYVDDWEFTLNNHRLLWELREGGNEVIDLQRLLPNAAELREVASKTTAFGRLLSDYSKDEILILFMMEMDRAKKDLESSIDSAELTGELKGLSKGL